jgi:hypothetical protein
VRIEPRIGTGERKEPFLAIFDKVVMLERGQIDSDTGPLEQGRRLRGMSDPRLCPDVVDVERDMVSYPTRLDDGLAGCPSPLRSSRT